MYGLCSLETARHRVQATLNEGLKYAQLAGSTSLEQTLLTNLVNLTDGRENAAHSASLQSLLQSIGRSCHDDCAICLEPLPMKASENGEEARSLVTALQCGHLYCRECVERLPNARCPQCLMPLPCVDAFRLRRL